MAGPESRFRSELRLLLKSAGIFSIPVENALTTPGLPDLHLQTGFWVELKVASKWPVRETTPLRVEHFTSEQRSWAKWWTSGPCPGAYRFLIKVAGEWFLFDENSCQEVGHMTRKQMSEKAMFHWKKKPTSEQLKQAFVV